MNPLYFKRNLTPFEAEAFLNGLSRRYRQSWEQARMVSYYAAAPLCKDLKMGDMPRFAWDEEHQSVAEAPSKEEIDELRQMASQYMKENGK